MRALLVVATAVLVACGSPVAAVRPPSSYVPWAPLPQAYLDPAPPPTGTPLPVPAGTPYCAAGQLEGKVIAHYSNLSNPDAPVALRNTASSPCYLQGVPDLTILDSYGRVLSTGHGAAGVGTYFDATTEAVAALMQPGTASLDADVNFGQGRGLGPGQAFFNVEWIGCTEQRSAKLEINLPGGAGRFTIPFEASTNGPDVCSRTTPVMRGPFDPTGVSWPPDRHLLDVEVGIAVPSPSVKRGSTLEYFVTLRNRGAEDYPLASSCPDYWQSLTAVKSSTSYQLNCGPAGVIRPGASVIFEMRMAVGEGLPVGPATLLWNLSDRRIVQAHQEAAITIA